MLRNILDTASADNSGRSPNDQKIGDYYYSCMDETGIDAKGIAPLKPELDRINAITDKKQVAGTRRLPAQQRRQRAVQLRLGARLRKTP